MRLFGGGVVPFPGVQPEFRLRCRSCELNLELAPFAVSAAIARIIAKNILIPQFVADLHDRARKLDRIMHRKQSTSGNRCNFIQLKRTLPLLDSRSIFVEESDRVYLHACSPQQSLYLGFSLPAV